MVILRWSLTLCSEARGSGGGERLQAQGGFAGAMPALPRFYMRHSDLRLLSLAFHQCFGLQKQVFGE